MALEPGSRVMCGALCYDSSGNPCCQLGTVVGPCMGPVQWIQTTNHRPFEQQEVSKELKTLLDTEFGPARCNDGKTIFFSPKFPHGNSELDALAAKNGCFVVTAKALVDPTEVFVRFPDDSEQGYTLETHLVANLQVVNRFIYSDVEGKYVPNPLYQ